MSYKPTSVVEVEQTWRPVQPERWFRTPGGIMRLVGPARSAEPASTYIDRDQKYRTYHDARCKATRPPLWFKRTTVGEELLEARKAARQQRRAERRSNGGDE